MENKSEEYRQASRHLVKLPSSEIRARLMSARVSADFSRTANNPATSANHR